MLGSADSPVLENPVIDTSHLTWLCTSSRNLSVLAVLPALGLQHPGGSKGSDAPPAPNGCSSG